MDARGGDWERGRVWSSQTTVSGHAWKPKGARTGSNCRQRCADAGSGGGGVVHEYDGIDGSVGICVVVIVAQTTVTRSGASDQTTVAVGVSVCEHRHKRVTQRRPAESEHEYDMLAAPAARTSVVGAIMTTGDGTNTREGYHAGDITTHERASDRRVGEKAAKEQL